MIAKACGIWHCSLIRCEQTRHRSLSVHRQSADPSAATPAVCLSSHKEAHHYHLWRCKIGSGKLGMLCQCEQVCKFNFHIIPVPNNIRCCCRFSLNSCL